MGFLDDVFASARSFISNTEAMVKNVQLERQVDFLNDVIENLRDAYQDKEKQALKSELSSYALEGEVHTELYQEYQRVVEAYGKLSSDYAELEVENERLGSALADSENELDDVKTALKCLLDGEFVKTFSFRFSEFDFINKHDVKVEFIPGSGIVTLVPWEE